MAIGQFSGGSGALTVAVTPILSGTDGRILYDNAGKVGEMTTTGSGTVVALQTGAALITPALGVATATSLAIGGATLGGNALAVTGHLLLEGVTSTGATGTNLLVFATSPTLTTPVLGVATASSIAIGGATLGGNTLAVTGTVLFNDLATMVSGVQIGTAASKLTSPTDGYVVMTNAAGSDFAGLRLGGSSNSFPMLFRASTTINVALADNSAFASIKGKLTTETAFAAGVIVPNGSLKLYDANGTGYLLAAVAA